MTDKQKRLRELTERQSRERARMSELARLETRSAEENTEYDGLEEGIADLEREIRQAQREVDAEEAEHRAAGAGAVAPELDAEDRERAEIRSRVRMASYIAAAVEQRAADGAEAEYNAALGIAGNRFPLELLAPPAPAVETRATTDVDTSSNQKRWIDRLFAGTAAAHLGITMESVEPGAASYPVTTAGASAAQRAKEQAAADTAWTVGVTELKPTRNAASLKFTLEDTARIPGLESALTRDLRMALTEGIDRSIFVGDEGATGTDADITGLQTATGVTERTITQAAKVTGEGVLKSFGALIDGKHAMTAADLRVVLAVGANQLWFSERANTGASSDTLIGELMTRAGISWVTRADIEAATTADKFGGFVGLGRGIEGAGVAPVWAAGELIRDPYTGAGKGEVILTLSYLWAFGLPRPSNFARLKFVA